MQSNDVITRSDRPSRADKRRAKGKPPFWARWAGYLAIASIFGTAFVVVERPLAINMSFVLAALAIASLVLFRRGRVGGGVMLAGVAILVHGVIGIAFDTTSISLMAKVYASSILFYVAFAMVIDIFRHKIDDLIHIYVVCCLAVAMIGLIQGGFFLAGFKPGYDFSWFLNLWTFSPGGPLGLRLNSILVEPSQVAFTMGPMIALAFYRIFNIGPEYLSLPAALVIFLFALLSGSSSVLICLAIAAILVIRISMKTAMAFVLAGLLLSAVIINSIYLEASLLKLRGLLDLMREGADAASANATTYTLFVHFKVAFANFFETWGFGGGLGSHEHVFGKYGSEYEGLHNIWSISTAGNLAFRLISELGVFGLAIIGTYFFLAVSGMLRLPLIERMLHAALIAGIGAFFVRNGTYAHFGLAFYVILLLVNYKDGLWRLRYPQSK